jgi:ATP-dependent helicase/DNAse subunit B
MLVRMGQPSSQGPKLIVGPPNSGRSGALVRLLAADAGNEPVLVVPGVEEAERFERDLCAEGASIGISIRTFPHLFEEIAALTAGDGDAPGPRLSAAQRLALARAATAATPLRILRRSAERPGFAIALDALIAELQAALVEPRAFRAHAEAADGDSAAELELGAIYESYVALRDGSGRSDEGSVALAALKGLERSPQSWDERPVYLYGFDDLNEAQLELVRLLCTRSPVTIAVIYSDQRALTARSELYTRLRDQLGGEVVAELEFEAGYTQRDSLRHLDQRLFEPGAGRVPADDGIRLLEAAGERGEAEAVGREIAALLASGSSPEEIVVALRRPGADGPLMSSVLRSMAIPVALAGRLPIDRTAVGRALVELCTAAFPGPGVNPAAALLAHLRSDPSVPAGVADRLERRMRREGQSEIDELIGEWNSPPRHLARVREAAPGAPALRALARCARDLAQSAHAERAPLAGDLSDGVPLDPIELRAARVAAETLDELAAAGELPGCPAPSIADAVEALQAATVPAWRGTTEGRVRIAGPARLRGARARYLFCAGMQEGVFPGRSSTDPLLGEQARSRLAIPALRRREESDDERYLFHVCVSRPTERLYLSWRQSDDDGRPLPRSPFIDEVLDLIGDGSERSEDELKETTGLADVVPDLRQASTARALARALAVRGHAGEESERAVAAVDVPEPARRLIVSELLAVPDPDSKPGPLVNPAVLASLAERKLLSANSLEGWIECSYRWFVQHELAPQRLEPEPDPLWLGSVVHGALHRLYLDPPGDDSIPRPDDVHRWSARFGELLDEEVEKASSPAGNPARRIALARVLQQVEAFLVTESQSETDMRPRLDLLEVGFGFGEGEPSDERHERGAGDTPEPLDLGEIALRGRIDRIDVSPDGRSALLRDYKTSRKVAGAKQVRDEGKLQIQLYMLAMRQLIGLDPVGGLYQPLGATGQSDRRPRGMVRDDADLSGFSLVGTDKLDPERFEEELEEATKLATAKGKDMLGGRITRDPIGGSCPRWCAYQPICRLERAVGVEEDG